MSLHASFMKRVAVTSNSNHRSPLISVYFSIVLLLKLKQSSKYKAWNIWTFPARALALAQQLIIESCDRCLFCVQTKFRSWALRVTGAWNLSCVRNSTSKYGIIEFMQYCKNGRNFPGYKRYVLIELLLFETYRTLKKMVFCWFNFTDYRKKPVFHIIIEQTPREIWKAV